MRSSTATVFLLGATIIVLGGPRVLSAQSARDTCRAVTAVAHEVRKLLPIGNRVVFSPELSIPGLSPGFDTIGLRSTGQTNVIARILGAAVARRSDVVLCPMPTGPCALSQADLLLVFSAVVFHEDTATVTVTSERNSAHPRLTLIYETVDYLLQRQKGGWVFVARRVLGGGG